MWEKMKEFWSSFTPSGRVAVAITVAIVLLAALFLLLYYKQDLSFIPNILTGLIK